MASKHTARNLLAAAFSSVGSDDFGDARGFLERADREVKRLREEGCDDIQDAPKKVSRLLGTRFLARFKRKESKTKQEECEAPERSRSMLKFARKALFIVALPAIGALGVTHYEKVTALLPDFGTAERSEFQLADACLGCGTITEQIFSADKAFCTSCGRTEVKEVVAAKLTSGWTHIGWQLPDGQTILLDEESEFEIPPLRVRGDSTKLIRF